MRLLLAGGGHAHLAVLRSLSRAPLRGIDVTLVTPSTEQIYSGMVPGWMAGHYQQGELIVDLRRLAEAAGVHLIVDEVAGMDARRRCVALPGGAHLHYDVLSLDVGSETDLSCLAVLGDALLPVRPLSSFLARWPEVRAAALSCTGFHLVIVGGGAAGVELAFAARHALQGAAACSVQLVSSARGLMPGHAASVVRRVHRLLRSRDISVIEGNVAGVPGGLQSASGEIIAADIVIAATGAKAPAWLQVSGLALDAEGFVQVGPGHASISHPEVFATGDVCSRVDVAMGRSGVHAVHAGPVLAHNLRALLEGGNPMQYRPRRHSLYLLATGPRHAVVSWGALSAQGGWAWQWKDRIDRRFIARNRVRPA